MYKTLSWMRRHWQTFALPAIVVVAAYLRLWKISAYLTFLGDEGRDVLVVARMITEHKFTLLGPTASVGGFFLGPIYYYFMLPFLWLWRFDPTGPAVMVALFGIATVWLLYRTGNMLFDRVVGLMAAALYALSPLVISYSRSSWNPNLVPFFSLLLVWCLWKTTEEKRPGMLFWIGVIIGIGLQLHYLFLFLIPFAALWLLFFGKPGRRLRHYLFGIAGFGVGYSPFLAFELRHGFPNTRSIIRFILAGQDVGFSFGRFLATVADVSYRIFGRLVYRIPEAASLAALPPWQEILWRGGTVLGTILALALILLPSVWAVVRSRANERGFIKKIRTFLLEPEGRQAMLLLALWFGVSIVLFGLYRKNIYDYYFGIVFPLPFLLTALVLADIARINVVGRMGAAAVFIGLVVLNWQGRPFVYAPNNQLSQMRGIAQTALSKANGLPFNFALITSSNSDYAYRYFFEIWGHPPVTIEPVSVDPDRRSVTDQLIVICEFPDCHPLGNSLWEIAGFGRAQIVGEWVTPFVKIFKLEHYTGTG
ncbi:glycosyltransferase family 39 protein [Patescibacteria group bacterium]|nr:glycosyltransferase family 39 protein [Patescibacteria group bacterium]